MQIFKHFFFYKTFTKEDHKIHLGIYLKWKTTYLTVATKEFKSEKEEKLDSDSWGDTRRKQNISSTESPWIKLLFNL